MEKILLLPHDIRPPNYEFPVALGEIAGISVIVPPAVLLQEIDPVKRSKELQKWLFDSIREADAAIISIESFCLGGLFPSREYKSSLVEAEERLRIFSSLKRSFPDKKIFGLQVLTRLNPIEALLGLKEDELRLGELLAEWAKEVWKARFVDPEGGHELLRELEAKIPAGRLEMYRRVRQRNLRVLMATLGLAAANTIDFLAISLDDTAPMGIHREEIRQLEQEIARLGIRDRTNILPGTDETTLVLLSRALLEREGWRPKIFPLYSSATGPAVIGRYEDRPMHHVVAAQIALAGADLALDRKQTDILLFVHTPQKEQQEHTPDAEKKDPSKLTVFLEDIASCLKRGQAVALADVAYANGVDPGFFRCIEDRIPLARLSGFAAWNTAGNTIGCAISHAILRWLFLRRKDEFRFSEQRAIDLRHHEFLMERFGDDGDYQADLRQQYRRDGLKAGIVPVDVHHESLIRMLLMHRTQRRFCEHFLGVELVTGERLRGFAIEKFSFPLNRYFEISLRIKLYPEELRVVNIPSPRIVKRE